MEEAKVTQEATPVQPAAPVQQARPSLVTDDDLKHEIGEWVVASLNKDKMLNVAVGRINAMATLIQEQVAQIQERDALKKSNGLLGDKNVSLADTIDGLRRDIADRDKAIADIDAMEALKQVLVDDAKAARNDLEVAHCEFAVAIHDKELEIEKLKARYDQLLKKRTKKV